MKKILATMLIILISVIGAFIFLNHKDDLFMSTTRLDESSILYKMPEESAPHEGTWLEWPHQYQYGFEYRNSLDAIWVQMTKALINSENVHIIAYDEAEKLRIMKLLTSYEVELTNVDFKIYPNDDVWIRDNGPIYVHDKSGQLVIQDWGFNGWGQKEGYDLSDSIPSKIAIDQSLSIIDLNKEMINEGGAVEMDGNATLMATRSSILNNNRNPGMSQSQAEAIFNKNLGITNFIWLDGVAGLEITDMHIDGFARFGNKNTIITMRRDDLQEWQVSAKDIETLYGSKDKNDLAYNFVEVPLTNTNVITPAGKDLGYKGSYINYYIANNVVLVPNYFDSNDTIANEIIQRLYPNRKVIGIDVRNLYQHGGMIHCVTQQQPK